MRAAAAIAAWAALCWGAWLAAFAVAVLCDERKKKK